MASLHVWAAYTAQEHYNKAKARGCLFGKDELCCSIAPYTFFSLFPYHFSCAGAGGRTIANASAYSKGPRRTGWSSWFSSWYGPVTTESQRAEEVEMLMTGRD